MEADVVLIIVAFLITLLGGLVALISTILDRHYKLERLDSHFVIKRKQH